MRFSFRLVCSLIVGAIGGASVVLPIGLASSQLVVMTSMVGAIAGAAVGAIWHWGWVTGPTLTGIVSAALCTSIGTGCDYTGGAAIWGFLLGFGAAHGMKRLRREMRDI